MTQSPSPFLSARNSTSFLSNARSNEYNQDRIKTCSSSQNIVILQPESHRKNETKDEGGNRHASRALLLGRVK
jgi:hypothetical protein